MQAVLRMSGQNDNPTDFLMNSNLLCQQPLSILPLMILTREIGFCADRLQPFCLTQKVTKQREYPSGIEGRMNLCNTLLRTKVLLNLLLSGGLIDNTSLRSQKSQ